MNNELLLRIQLHVRSSSTPQIQNLAPEAAVIMTESQLGFSLPPLLKDCYRQIGNGGFGPGYGLIGVFEGAKSDFGTLFETYKQLESDQEIEGNKWKIGLLPFCSWGCNIFSCVDCFDPRFEIYVFEEFEIWPQKYSLERFFEMWLNDVDILSYGSCEEIKREIVNPFTGKTDSVVKKTRST